jgi:multiple sugar transport system substrate-binding protein
MKRVLAGALVGGGLLASQAAVADDVTLEFVVWNYSLSTIQDNIRIFEEENPGIKVNLTDYAWPDYQDSMVLRFRGNTRTDVLYGGQDWLPAWASAGWVAPLSAIAPEGALDTLAGEMADFALADVTYGGDIYGLPYYADTISFIYNEAVLEEHGIAVPQTWDAVMAAAQELKAAGMDRPIVYEYNQELPNFFDAFVAQVYGRGGDLFDDELNAVFDDPDNAAYQHLEWLREAFEKDLVQPENHESNIITTMNTGEHAFTIVYNYVLAAMNNKGEQPLAGDFALARMPGKAHDTLGFAKFYAVTADAAADPERAQAAWKFVQFMAGQPYTVAKRWAVEDGLGFAQLPLLQDEEVIETWNDWVDMDTLSAQIESARSGTWTEWTAVWSAYFRPLLASAMVGEISVDEAMTQGAERWNMLKEQFARRQ